MGILLQVAFRGSSWGTVLARRDDAGHFLVRELDDNNCVHYRIINSPPIPLDSMSLSDSQIPVQNDYVQMSDDVFVDLSNFHPLMYISRPLVYSYLTRNNIEQVELLLTFPRNYADKIERQLELCRGNEVGVGQNWVAEDILFYGNDEMVVYNIVAIQVVDRGDSKTEFKLILHSRSKAHKRRQRVIMRSQDLNCTLVLNNGRRDFFLGTQENENKKGHQI